MSGGAALDFDLFGSELADLEAEVEGLLGTDRQRDVFLDQGLEALGGNSLLHSFPGRRFGAE